MKGKALQNKNYLGVLFFSSILCLLFGWLYSRNSLFRLSEIEVSGVDDNLKKEIQEKIIEYYGRGLFSISLSDIENKVLILPQIEKISLHRRWPSKLMVEVEEKIPVALSPFKQNIWWVDKKGELVQIAQNLKGKPMLVGFHSKEDGTFLLPANQVQEFFAWFSNEMIAYSPSKTGFNILELSWEAKRGVRVKISEIESAKEIDVDLGFEQFELAWTRAKLALTFFKSKNLAVDLIDSTYSRRVVAHIKTGLKPESRLQNSQNVLNLKELVRRTEQPLTNDPPAAR